LHLQADPLDFSGIELAVTVAVVFVEYILGSLVVRLLGPQGVPLLEVRPRLRYYGNYYVNE